MIVLVLLPIFCPDGCGLDARVPVQEVDLKTYLYCYKNYQNEPNGTKDTTDINFGPGAGPEFMGENTIAGTVACENLGDLREFQLRMENERRAKNGEAPLKFFIRNTGLKTSWGVHDPENRADAEIQAFANAARHMANVSGLLPDELRDAILKLEEVTGVNTGQLAMTVKHWDEQSVQRYLISPDTITIDDTEMSHLRQFSDKEYTGRPLTFPTNLSLIERFKGYSFSDVHELAYKIVRSWAIKPDMNIKNMEERQLICAYEYARQTMSSLQEVEKKVAAE